MKAATQRQESVDGRVVTMFPGNLELLESSVYWLANQDELIAQSPSAQSVAVIQPMQVNVLSGLRITMIAGLTFAVLALGGVLRLLRG